MSIEDMVREWAREQAPKPKPPTLLVEALRDQAQFYTHENPFKVGDVVTPRKGVLVTGSGDPNIVIAVRENPDPVFAAGEPGSSRYGLKFDIRVVRWEEGQFPTFWTESSFFEPWIEPAAKAEDAPAADPASTETRVSAIEAA